MKPVKSRSKTNSEGPRTSISSPASAPVRSAPPKWKVWVFRGLLVFGFPLLLLGGGELALRLAGYGYPTRFFMPVTIQGEQRLVENPRFSWRFFPPTLARTPQPVNIPAAKPPHVQRIFVFGESAAMGDPEPAYGFPRMLSELLKTRYPELQFEVVNLAMTAINSHVIRVQAIEAAQRQGDIWVFYMGNNEVVGPFGAGTVMGKQSASLLLVRANLALRASRLGQLFSTLPQHLQASSDPQEWGGMEMFLQHQVPSWDPRLEAVYHHFSRNLADCLQAGLMSGAQVFLSTVAVNLQECPPFASMHSPQLAADALKQWSEIYAQSCQYQSAGEYAKAIQGYQQAARLDNGYAELHFRWAQCAERLGKASEATLHFEQARDLDCLRFRADHRINQIIVDSARQYSHARLRLIDLAEPFRQASQNGISEEKLFFEHVHLTPDGNYLLARQVAQGITESLALQPSQPGDWLSLDQCLKQLGMTSWHHLKLLENVYARLQKPPFTSQLDHAQRLDRIASDLRNLKSSIPANQSESWIETCRQALAGHPGDWQLHSQMAKLLEGQARVDEAVPHWRRVIELAPNYVMGYYQLGRALNRGKDRSETIALMNRALRIVPHFPEAYNSLGIAQAHQNLLAEACQSFSQAVKLRPYYPEVHLNWGITLLAFGQTNQAVTRFQEAARLKPDYAEAHHRLGMLFVRLDRLEEAQREFAQAVASNPSWVTARYDLGVALARLHRFQEAKTQFQEVLRLDSNHATARSMLQTASALLKQSNTGATPSSTLP